MFDSKIKNITLAQEEKALFSQALQELVLEVNECVKRDKRTKQNKISHAGTTSKNIKNYLSFLKSYGIDYQVGIGNSGGFLNSNSWIIFAPEKILDENLINGKTLTPTRGVYIYFSYFGYLQDEKGYALYFGFPNGEKNQEHGDPNKSQCIAVRKMQEENALQTYDFTYEYLDFEKIINDFEKMMNYFMQFPSPDFVLENYQSSQIDFNDKKKERLNQTENKALNQILYGPPGTGKTYDTIKKALKILEVDTKSKNRQELKELFEDYKSKGQIEFVTFHQSFSYEEFIEGIKPMMSEENNMTYEVQNGIFREICKKALANYQESQESHQSSNFEELFQAYALSLKEKLDQGENITFYKSMKICSINLEKSGKIYSIGIGVNPQSLQNLSLKIFLRDYQDFKQGKIKNYKDIKPTYESTSLWHGNAIYYFKLYEKLQEFEKQEFHPYNQEKKKSELKPYILIIDEINRGNVSKIFGELITLIEPSKRIGADEELRVTLPYSSDSFGVPKNLYIIGTMNTADRSITSLDTALRRRFEFIEMMPDSQTLINLRVYDEGEDTKINLKELLEAINQRIEFLYDREKTIGHTFFLSENKEYKGKIILEQLKGIFQNKIIPLLQEYFYNDYEAIDAVLNSNGMIQAESKTEYLTMEKFQKFIDDKGFEKKIFKITAKNDGVWDDPQTYIKIYSPTHSSQNQDNENK